jgi:uncharacterized protein YbjT (DUF2867 family)
VRILLVGCSGFVGRALVPLLLERGHSLSLISRSAAPLPALKSAQLARLQAIPPGRPAGSSPPYRRPFPRRMP